MPAAHASRAGCAEDLPHEQVAQVLRPVWVGGEEQDAPGRREHEHHPDHRLLHVRPDALGPREQQGAAERGRERRDLHRDPLGVEAEAVGEQHAAAGDLRDREVDEHDAAREHLHAQRHVGGGHEEPGRERG